MAQPIYAVSSTVGVAGLVIHPLSDEERFLALTESMLNPPTLVYTLHGKLYIGELLATELFSIALVTLSIVAVLVGLFMDLGKRGVKPAPRTHRRDYRVHMPKPVRDTTGFLPYLTIVIGVITIGVYGAYTYLSADHYLRMDELINLFMLLR